MHLLGELIFLRCFVDDVRCCVQAQVHVSGGVGSLFSLLFHGCQVKCSGVTMVLASMCLVKDSFFIQFPGGLCCCFCLSSGCQV